MLDARMLDARAGEHVAVGVAEDESAQYPISGARRHFAPEYVPDGILGLRCGLVGFDAFLLVFAAVIACDPRGRFYSMLLPTITAVTASLLLISFQKGYRLIPLQSLRGQFRLLLCAFLLWLLIIWAASLTLPESERHPLHEFLGPGLAMLGLAITVRAYLAWLISRWRRSGCLDRTVAVVGINETSRDLIRRLRQERIFPARVTGVYGVGQDPMPVTHAGVLVRGDLDSLVRFTQEVKLGLVIIALPPDERELAHRIIDRLSTCVCDISVFYGVEPLPLRRCQFERIGDDLTLVVNRRPINGMEGVCKLALDRALAGIALIPLTPFLALIALAIRLESPGPLIFRQQRSGYNGRPFQILKFRTMYCQLSDPMAGRQTERDDPRVTRVGRVLRRTSLDELPQLINVLRGEMSLVGPRPHAPGTRAGFQLLDEASDQYKLRYRVKPGITGLAQVNGCRGAIRSEVQLQERVTHDICYIEDWSLLLDLKILGRTVIRGFFGRNAY